MAAILPQLAPASEDRVTGAQQVDGSLRFPAELDTSNLSSTGSCLKKTFASAGSRKTWTWSCWVKRNLFPSNHSAMFSSGTVVSDTGFFRITFHANGHINVATGSTNILYSGGTLKDDQAWYHVCVVVDTNLGSNQTKCYVNGDLYDQRSAIADVSTSIGNSVQHKIGQDTSEGKYAPFQLSQVYFIDGQALGPEYFGFEDTVTGNWRPRGYSNGYSYTLTAPTYNSGQGSDVTTTEFDKMVDGDLSTYGQGNGASGTNRFIGFSLAEDSYLKINVKIKNTTGSALDFIVQPSVSGSGLVSQGVFASTGNDNGTVNVPANTTLEDTFSFPAGFEGFGRIYLNNSGNDADAWEIYDFGGTKVTTNSFYLPFDGNSPIGKDQSGLGNDWELSGEICLSGPVDSASVTGAKPILNTSRGGKVARPGVFGSDHSIIDDVSSSSGGGNPYIFDNSGTQPTFNFIRGVTYTFDYSNASSHPLRFATAADAAGSTEYTDGTDVSGNVITFTVPHDAPDTLYYYCTNHNGMGNSISVTTDETKADPYASKCFLALPLCGNTSDVSSSLNATSTEKTATNSGVTVVRQNRQFYGSSHYWGQNTDSLTYAEQGDELVFGTGDYTIECWLFDDGTHNGGGSGRCYIFDNRIGGSVVGDPPTLVGYIDGHNSIKFYDGDSDITHTVSDTRYRWIHYAVTREGTTTRMFIDGVLVGSSTNSTNFTNNGIGVGRATDGGYGWSGYIQDFRVYKGIAKYTSGFVCPEAESKIVSDSPSGNVFDVPFKKSENGSVTFDGVSDFLVVSEPGSDFAFGTGDFTVETYIYQRSRGTYDYIIDGRNSGQTTGTWSLSYGYAGGNGRLEFASGSSTLLECPASKNPEINRWYHVAVARSGTSLKMFVDGYEVASATDSTNFSTEPTRSYIGTRYSNQHHFDGYMSNMRIVKGTALYTKRFKPPTRLLDNVSNTKLLMFQEPKEFNNGGVPILNTNVTGITTSAGEVADHFRDYLVLAIPFANSTNDVHSSIKGSGSNKVVTNNGAVGVTTSKFYGGSYYFNQGDNKYLSIPDSSDFDFGGSDFTIEFWMNESSSQTGNPVIIGAENGWYIQSRDAGRRLEFYDGSNSHQSSLYNYYYLRNQWRHIAVTKTSSTIRWFVDGELSSSASNSSSTINLVNTMNIGRYGAGTLYYTGMLQDIRIYKGVCKYTTSFEVNKTHVQPDSVVTPGGNPVVPVGAHTQGHTVNPFVENPNVTKSQESAYACMTSKINSYDSYFDYRNGNLWVERLVNDTRCYTNFVTKESEGKYYVEAEIGQDSLIGIAKIYTVPNTYPGGNAGTYGLFASGTFYDEGTAVSNYCPTFLLGDTVGILLDLDAGTLAYTINGVYHGVAASGITGQYHFSSRGGRAWDQIIGKQNPDRWNFGQMPFRYSPPEGFRTLSATTLRTDQAGAILESGKFFNAKKWTGDNTPTRKITGLGFKPDAVWIKPITAVNQHHLADSVRGATTRVQISDNNIEETRSDCVKSFDMDGFTIGDNGAVNGGADYIAWSWKAGGGKPGGGGFFIDDVEYASAAASGMDAGSTNAEACSVNTKSKFSIVRYTGSSGTDNVAHGLGVAPNMIWVRRVDANSNWKCWYNVPDLAGGGNYMVLNSTAGRAINSDEFSQGGAPNATTFGIGANNNSNTGKYMAYCWANVPGYQMFTSYTYHGTRPFQVNLGFRPAFIILKRIGVGDNTNISYANWFLADTARSPSNNVLYSESLWVYSSEVRGKRGDRSGTNAGSYLDIEINANGFVIPTTGGGAEFNQPNDQVIVMAWAETPQFNFYGSQANAR